MLTSWSITDDNPFLPVIYSLYIFSVVYGVSTGFGKFARVVIPREDLEELQVNLIESHCVGVGNPLPPGRTRMMLALRINILCKGYSGISISNLKILEKGFNSKIVEIVAQVLRTLQSVQEVWGSIPAIGAGELVKLGTEPPTTCHSCNVSSELCFLEA